MRRPWSERPFEVANLFNPAYCCLILRNVADGYSTTNKPGLPYALAFLALPILLHDPSSVLLPATAKTKLHVWLQQQPEIRVGFVDRVRNTNNFTKEAIFFGIRHRSLGISEDGEIESVKKRTKALLWPHESNQQATLKRASLVGKLFSQVNDVSNVFAMLGVRP